MTQDARIALFLMGELVAALRANDPDAFRGLLTEGIQELGLTEVEELLLDWLDPFLTSEEQDRLLGWNLGGESLVLIEDCLFCQSSCVGVCSSNNHFKGQDLTAGPIKMDA